MASKRLTVGVVTAEHVERDGVLLAVLLERSVVGVRRRRSDPDLVAQVHLNALADESGRSRGACVVASCGKRWQRAEMTSDGLR
eukprot:COSAG06_NODE_42502_length_381_cov_0.730496_1_plen_83_part_10